MAVGASLDLDPAREIFPFPFVKLVNAYVSFDEELAAADHDAILRPILDANYTVVISAPDDEKADRGLFSAVHEADMVTVFQDALYFSTARYERWERTRGAVAELLESVTSGRGIESLSVRFLDEIRPPTPTGIFEWHEYVRLPVVTQDVVLDHVEGHHGGLILHLADDKHVTIRWAPTSEAAIPEDHPLSHYYEAPQDSALAVEWIGWQDLHTVAKPAVVVQELDSLQASIKESFMRSLTPASLKLLRGEA